MSSASKPVERMIGLGWEGSGHGHCLPAWADPTDAEARRGTQFCRAVDPNLIVVRNRVDGTFLLCGPSLSLQGWVPVAICQDDDSVPYTAPVPWHLIVIALRRQYDESERGLFGPQKAAARQEAYEDRERREFRDRTQAAAAYSARAVQGELNGWGRWDGRDLSDGLICATEGRSKTPPRFRKTYSPGTVTPG